MGKGTKGKGKRPSFPVGSIEVESGEADEQEKNERMAEYPAAAKAISEEERSYRLVNDIRQKRSQK